MLWIKQFRRIATRFDKTVENFLAAGKPASIRIRLRGHESTASRWAAGMIRTNRASSASRAASLG